MQNSTLVQRLKSADCVVLSEGDNGVSGFMPRIEQQYNKQDFELLKREACYEGFFCLEKFTFKHRRFEGGWSRDVVREIFLRGDATCVLPYDPARNCVVLLEQFRVGAILFDQNPWLIELVAGINDVGETPEQVARREGLEEANLEFEHLEPIMSYLPSPGGSSEKVFLFCACVDAGAVEGLFGLEHEDEDIRVHRVDLEDAVAMLNTGQINNAPAIIALQWLQLNRERLIKAWLPGDGGDAP